MKNALCVNLGIVFLRKRFRDFIVNVPTTFFSETRVEIIQATQSKISSQFQSKLKPIPDKILLEYFQPQFNDGI